MARESKSGKPLLFIIALLLGVMLLYQFGFSETTSVAESLKRAQEAIEKKDFIEAHDHLKHAANDESLLHWVTYQQGVLALNEKRWGDAYLHFSRVPEKSPAALDAQIEILKLLTLAPRDELPKKSLPASIGRFIIDVEKEAKRLHRSDLTETLLFLKAAQEAREKNVELAMSLFRTLRTKYPEFELITKARETMQALRSEMGGSAAELLDEARLLLSEKAYEEALAHTQAVRELASTNTSASFESLLLEQRALRGLGRVSEADSMLQVVAADGGIGSGDEALNQLIMQNWNSNEHKQALERIESFKKRFNRSPLLDDVKYAEARILGEMGLIADSKSAHRRLATSSRELLDRIKNQKRIAWLLMRENNLGAASEEFLRLKQLAVPLLGSEDDATLQRELEEEYQHATFWLSYTKHKSESDAGEKNPHHLLEELSETFPPTYYSLLASMALKKPIRLSRLVEPKSASTECFVLPDDLFLKRVLSLGSARLNNFAKKEIIFYFRNSYPTSLDKSAEELSVKDLQALLTEISLQLRHGSPQSAIIQANASLRKVSSLAKPLACEGELFLGSYPLLHLEEFRQASADSGVGLPLLLGITRTESYFDAQAISKRDAQGLMQLLPSTAKAEGMKKGQSLHDPEVNIALGAKHFSGLLSSYDGEEVYAIAAYNAGSTPVRRWRDRAPGLTPLAWAETISYPETRNYVRKVSSAKLIYQALLEAVARSNESKRSESSS